MNACNEVYIKKKNTQPSIQHTNRKKMLNSSQSGLIEPVIGHTEGYRNSKELTAKSFTIKWMQGFSKGCHLGNASFTAFGTLL